jgi:aerobic carbon-monoxide dehydrogenase medium subunit
LYLPHFELHDARTLDDAAALMARHGPNARLLAGGTDLLVDLKTGRFLYDHLVSLNRIDGLRGVSAAEGGLKIGALATVTELIRSPAIRERFVPILDAALRMAAPQIRNVATVGGNIAAAVPCADLPPILTAMNASVLLWSLETEREVPLAEFFLGARQTVMQVGEILSAVRVPEPERGFGAAYERFSLRDGNAIAVASVAASLTLDSDGTIGDARVILGAVAPVPKIVRGADDVLVVRAASDDAFGAAAELAMTAADPISDIRGSADFRREIVGVLTRRALFKAHERARETLQC